jgi:hypothetical protein
MTDFASLSQLILPSGQRLMTPTVFDLLGRGPRYDTIPILTSKFQLAGKYSVEIPVDSLTTLLDQLTTTLSNIHQLSKYEWEADYFMWKIEYASRPLEQLVHPKSYTTVTNGKWAALQAACRAVELFPHLIPNDDDHDMEFNPIYDVKKWHKSEIHLFYNPVSSKYIVAFNRMTGDHTSSYYTWSQILTQLCHMNGMDIPDEYRGLVANFPEEN